MAFRTRRHRRRTGQWLPNEGSLYNATNAGTNPTVDAQNSYLTILDSNLPVGINGSTLIEAILTPADVMDPEGGAAANPNLTIYQSRNLADQQGFGYKLERLVGTLKVFCSPSANQQRLTPSVVIVGAGLMVRHFNSEDNAQSEAAANISQADPLALGNITDPWLWRRTWLLSPANAGGPNAASSPAGSDNFDAFANVFQPSNTVFTGLYDTSTVDVKSKRTVKNEERLVLNIGVRSVGFDPTVDPGAVEIAFGAVFDYRIFARTFVNKGGNRRNASR